MAKVFGKVDTFETYQRPAATRAPTGRHDIYSETQTGEYYDLDRRLDEFANFILNQNLSDGIELDPRLHEHPEDHAHIFQVSRRKRHAVSCKLTTREQLERPCTIHC